MFANVRSVPGGRYLIFTSIDTGRAGFFRRPALIREYDDLKLMFYKEYYHETRQ